ncbi:MAG: hypothetical protein JKY27_09955 [Magnetovibrio sp.]|nr:hypothetical protein [Magnetovibrio sp.]
MDVLLHLTTPDAAKLAAPLGQALTRSGASWGCFLTNDGVTALDNTEFLSACADAERVAVCEHSWDLHMTGQSCPVEKGSQTINSALMAQAAKVISL